MAFRPSSTYLIIVQIKMLEKENDQLKCFPSITAVSVHGNFLWFVLHTFNSTDLHCVGVAQQLQQLM